jgi:hypothetical protein
MQRNRKVIQPFNDCLLVELPTSQWATADEQGEQDDPRAGYGKVVKVPEPHDIMYLSSYTWIADRTIGDKNSLIALHKTMHSLMGSTVYFEKRAEIGNVIEDGDKKFATIKLSKVIGIKE